MKDNKVDEENSNFAEHSRFGDNYDQLRKRNEELTKDAESLLLQLYHVYDQLEEALKLK